LSAASVVVAARPDAPSIGAGAAGLLGAAMCVVALIVGLAAAIKKRRRCPAQPLA
jgi:Ca2+/Na+ antiporter